MIFQSTRPGWGETSSSQRNSMLQSYFNPLAPGGARRAKTDELGEAYEFQSTRPGWGETAARRRAGRVHGYFNPLAPGGARRARTDGLQRDAGNFNPLVPGGARLLTSFATGLPEVFQSTRPGWGETAAL